MHSNLAELESEAIFLLREGMAQLERPALLFSGGKDSLVLAHLARRAFWPCPLPCPLLHIDSGHNFPETLEFLDRFAQANQGFENSLAQGQGTTLIVRRVDDSLARGRVCEESGPRPSRNVAQTTTLLDAVAELRLDGLFGGARRDEERARAKERLFSHRDRHGQWDPKNQRPECWWLVNALKHPGEHFRIFPLSNWTELDIWHYIQKHALDLPPLYFAHRRRVVQTQGMLLAECPWVQPLEGETSQELTVRFRTLGDTTCSGAIESTADTVEKIIAELKSARLSERGTRADDRRSEAAMEDRKKLGYF